MGLITMGPPRDAVLLLKQISGCETFVETGTFKGGTTNWASQYFDRVHTVEASKQLFQSTSARLSNLANVDFHYGDSRTFLEQMAKILAEPAIFWLDAHWSGGMTYGTNDECPLMQELDMVLESQYQHIILVDDARMFTAPPPIPHNADSWPSIGEVASKLHQHDMYVTIFDDVIFALPRPLKKPFQCFLQKKTTGQNPQNKGSALTKMILRFLRKNHR